MKTFDQLPAGVEESESFVNALGRSPKILWVVSSGGHLVQALRIEKAIGENLDSLWITFDTQQARSVLADRRHGFVRYIAPRDISGAIRAAHTIRRHAASEVFDVVASTGAAIAAIALPMVAMRGQRTVYIESIARSAGPSITGRVLDLAPHVHTYTQYRTWSNSRWPYSGTILDAWETRAAPSQTKRPSRILVTLGTIRPYRFDKAVDAVLSCLTPGDEVTWQLGATERQDLPGTVHSELSFEHLNSLAASADIVITHAGVGSILMALDAGKVPVLAVRDRSRSEHIDDHQRGIAELMSSRQLATILNLEAPTREPLDWALNRIVSVVEK